MTMSRIRPAIERLRIKHLRLFELLVELGTVRKAAERLHISQPAASQMLKELESAFGGTLFARTRGGVKAAQCATILLRRLRLVLGELCAAQSEMLTSTNVVLRIGANLQFLSHLLPHALESLRSSYPDLRFVLREGPTNTLIDELLAGDLDCTIGRLSMNARHAAVLAELRFWTLYGGELCLVVGRSHPLARRKRLTLQDLAGEAWALGGTTGQARKLLDQLFISAQLPPPQPILECRPQFANLAFVAKMQLVTVATRSDALAAQEVDMIRILPIELPVESAPVAFICRKVSADDVWLTRAREAVSLAAGRIK
jgi:DNA-binding transcriptional LysR family regulator